MSLHAFSQCVLVNRSAFRYLALFGNCMDPDPRTIILFRQPKTKARIMQIAVLFHDVAYLVLDICVLCD